MEPVLAAIKTLSRMVREAEDARLGFILTFEGDSNDAEHDAGIALAEAVEGITDAWADMKAAIEAWDGSI